jgi:hypothetical protein
MKLIFTVLIGFLTAGPLFGQMSDAKFVGLKGKVKAVWTERTYTEAVAGQKLNKPEFIKSLFYDKKGYLTRSSSFANGESRLMHSFVGKERRVDRFDFDTSKKVLPVKGQCTLPAALARKGATAIFDYFYRYRYDSRRRIAGVTQYCDANNVLMESTFGYNDDGRVISDVRCSTRTKACDNDYYQYSNGRLAEQKTTTTVKGVEMCVSITVYSGWEVDKKGNEIKRTGLTTDCSNNKKVFYKFFDVTQIDYY